MYVIVMRRWGEVETHSYVLGVWPERHVAIEKGIEARNERGGKYEAFLNETREGGYVVKRYVLDELGLPIHIKKRLDKIENDKAERCLCEYIKDENGQWSLTRRNMCPIHSSEEVQNPCGDCEALEECRECWDEQRPPCYKGK